MQSIAVETNPNHLHDEVLLPLQDAGVSRLSVGVQSFSDRLLQQMERLAKYGSSDVIQSRIANALGRFQTLNVDMIFDLPNQTMADLDQDLSILHGLDVDQVSFYPLMTAPTARRRMAQTMGLPHVQRRYEFYQRILERMLPRYQASTAWCFSRATTNAPAIDEYIVDHGDYVGVGSGSFSYVNGALYATTFSINQYLQRIGRGESGITQRKALTLRERMRYDFLVRLFGLELRKDYIRKRYGAPFYLLLAPELNVMRAVGATHHDQDAIRLTSRGMYYWIIMMSEFFNSVNFFREQMRRHIRTELEEYERDETVVPIAQLGRKLGGP